MIKSITLTINGVEVDARVDYEYIPENKGWHDEPPHDESFEWNHLDLITLDDNGHEITTDVYVLMPLLESEIIEQIKS